MVVTKGASSRGTQGYFHIKPPGFKNTVGWAGAHGARGTSLGRLPLSTSQLRSHSHPQAASPAHQCPGPSCSTLPVPQHPELQCCPRSGAGMKGRGSGTPPQHLSWQGLRGDSLGSANISGRASTAWKPGELQGRASP